VTAVILITRGDTAGSINKWFPGSVLGMCHDRRALLLAQLGYGLEAVVWQTDAGILITCFAGQYSLGCHL